MERGGGYKQHRSPQEESDRFIDLRKCSHAKLNAKQEAKHPYPVENGFAAKDGHLLSLKHF